MYERVEIQVFIRDPKRAPLGANGEPDTAAFTSDLAKKFLGWKTETQYTEELKKVHPTAAQKNMDLTFAGEYLLTDRNGDKVRCDSNLRNRPFDDKQAESYMLEILRNKWEFTGESMAVDHKGMTQDCQHRMIALVWAVQEWELDKAKPKPEQQWQEYWKEEPCIDCLLVLGIDDKDSVINVMNTGKGRTFADAMYRHKYIADQPTKVRERLSKIMQWSLRMLWDRTDAKEHSLAPRRPHSESFEFLDNHLKLLKSVKFINEEGDGKKLSPFLPLGYAASLLYLMASCRSDAEKYVKTGNEKHLNWELWEKAEEMFVLFCSNHPSLEPLREELERIPADSGRFGAESRVALFIKSWNIFSSGKKITRAAIELVTSTNEYGQMVLAEKPRCGGIDIDYGDPVEEGSGATAVDGGTDECLKGGEHEWKTEDGETFCSKCFDPKTVARKK